MWDSTEHKQSAIVARQPKSTCFYWIMTTQIDLTFHFLLHIYRENI